MENLSMSELTPKGIFSIRITVKRLKSAQWNEAVNADDRRPITPIKATGFPDRLAD
jgi:hypothetical protein